MKMENRYKGVFTYSDILKEQKLEFVGTRKKDVEMNLYYVFVGWLKKQYHPITCEFVITDTKINKVKSRKKWNEKQILRTLFAIKIRRVL